MTNRFTTISCGIAGILLLVTLSAQAQPTPFYKDKTIRIVEGAGHNPGAESEIDQIDWVAKSLGATG